MWGKEAKSHITRDKHDEKVAEAYRVVEQEYGSMPRNGVDGIWRCSEHVAVFEIVRNAGTRH
jgi:hypothetical protein